MPTTNDMDKKQQGLEPCEGRLSCTVLRGLGRGNMPWLPGGLRPVLVRKLDSFRPPRRGQLSSRLLGFWTGKTRQGQS